MPTGARFFAGVDLVLAAQSRKRNYQMKYRLQSINIALVQRIMFALRQTNPLGTRRCCDVERTSMTLIQRRNNAVGSDKTRHCPSAGSMLGGRLRRCPNLEPTQAYLVYSEKV